MKDGRGPTSGLLSGLYGHSGPWPTSVARFGWRKRTGLQLLQTLSTACLQLHRVLPGEPPCLTRREVQRTHSLLGAWRTCPVPGSVAFSRRKDGPGRSLLSRRGEEQALEPQGRQVTRGQRHLRAEPALTNHLLHSPRWAQAPKLPQAAPYKATSSPR